MTQESRRAQLERLVEEAKAAWDIARRDEWDAKEVSRQKAGDHAYAQRQLRDYLRDRIEGTK